MKRKSGAVSRALPELKKLVHPCRLCAHLCGAERKNGKKGMCSAGYEIAVYSYQAHHGEEPPLSGTRGSGAVFFTHCNMKCAYCQNYAFSRESDYEEISADELADRMLRLEEAGCHNINLVSPTHYAFQIVNALEKAFKKGLNLPIVYNTGGYDSVELIRLLDGIIDIYLPDMRYAADSQAVKYSNAPGYAKNNRLIIKEMFRQAGALKVNRNGIAKKGLIVRLLILPDNVSGTIETLEFLAREVSKDIYLSVMSQYYPAYKAREYPAIARRITDREYREVIDAVERLGFVNGWIQGLETDIDRFLGTNIKPT